MKHSWSKRRDLHYLYHTILPLSIGGSAKRFVVVPWLASSNPCASSREHHGHGSSRTQGRRLYLVLMTGVHVSIPIPRLRNEFLLRLGRLWTCPVSPCASARSKKKPSVRVLEIQVPHPYASVVLFTHLLHSSQLTAIMMARVTTTVSTPLTMERRHRSASSALANATASTRGAPACAKK